MYGPFNYPVDTFVYMGYSTSYNVAFYGAGTNDNIGFNSVRAADVSGDGIKDLLIESQYCDLGNQDTGCLYVVNGGTANFKSGTGNQADFANGISYNARYTQNNYGGQLTYTPTVVKDMDGDGYLDLVVTGGGYNYQSAGCNNAGTVSVFFGPTPSSTNNNYDVNSGGYDLRYRNANCNFTNAWVTAIGDFDGDGYLDATVNRRDYNSNAGRVWITSFSTGTARVTSPVLFTSSGVVSALTITWASVSGASQYQMLLDVDPRFPSPISNQTVSATQANVTGLTNGQSYYVKVRATNGNYNRFGPISSFTVDNTPPTAPTLIAPPNGGSVGTQTPTFNWTDASSE
jgi:hypothetical protein